jgi:hypothetical protein
VDSLFLLLSDIMAGKTKRKKASSPEDLPPGQRTISFFRCQETTDDLKKLDEALQRFLAIWTQDLVAIKVITFMFSEILIREKNNIDHRFRSGNR